MLKTKYLTRWYWSLFCLITKIVLGDIKSEIKGRVWNAGILLWWYRTDFYRSHIMKGEFDQSLSMDFEAMLAMTDKERDNYISDLAKRRNQAHEDDLEEDSLLNKLMAMSDEEIYEWVQQTFGKNVEKDSVKEHTD